MKGSTMPHQQAVIYCRVSDFGDTRHLRFQEEKSRQYAQEKNYEVTGVFKDKCHFNEIANRHGLNALLDYLNRQKHDQTIVIIDQFYRLSRSMITHLEIRNLLSKSGGKLESPTCEFRDDPESKLIEQMMLAKEQFSTQEKVEC